MNSPRRLVVVDDDSKVRLLLERAFRVPEFETHSFPTGAAALQRVAEIRPACVVSDILMPDMDGETLVRAVRAVPGLERVPFIAVSGVCSEARIRALLAAGADAFLVKPFPLRDLIEKVRTLIERSASARFAAGKTGEPTPLTLPVGTVPHTTRTARPATRAAPRVVVSPPSAPAAPATPVAVPPSTSVRVSPVRVVVPSAVPPGPGGSSPRKSEAKVRVIELSPTAGSLGFGRFTRVESRGRSFVVLTEAVAQPKFTVTTIITQGGVPLRKIESALAHSLAREEDRDTVRRQLDLQHDDTLRRFDQLVLDGTPRRVVWSDQSRSVEPGVLAWALSAVAQHAETEAGADETRRQLRLTRESALVEEASLRAFLVTPIGRVIVDPAHTGRLPRRAVRAAAGWCRAFATATLQCEPDAILEPVREATRSYATDLERMGFYERLPRRAKA